MSRFFGIFGIIFIFALAYLMSNNKKAINYKTVGIGFLLQVSLAFFIFKVPFGRALFMDIGVFIQKILDFAKEKNEEPFILLLDEIVDPHNFGAIIRTVDVIGAHGIIIKNRNQAMVTATVVSASAGASEYMKIARVNNLSKTIEELKQDGLWFACADMDGTPMTKTNLKGSIGLVVGNEGSGVSRLVKEKCDFTVSIPMKGHVDSMNVSVATGILLYEISRIKSSK